MVVFSFTIICLIVRNFYRIRSGSIIHSSWRFLVFRHKFPAIPKCTQTIPFVGLSRVYDKAVINQLFRNNFPNILFEGVQNSVKVLNITENKGSFEGACNRLYFLFQMCIGFHLGEGGGGISKGAILAVMSICLVPNCSEWTLLALVFIQTP